MRLLKYIPNVVQYFGFILFSVTCTLLVFYNILPTINYIYATFSVIVLILLVSYTIYMSYVAIKYLKYFIIFSVTLGILFSILFPHVFIRSGMMTNNIIYNICTLDYSSLSIIKNIHNLLTGTYACLLLLIFNHSNIFLYSVLYNIMFLLSLIFSQYFVYSRTKNIFLSLSALFFVAFDIFYISSYLAMEYVVLAIPYIILFIHHLLRREYWFSAFAGLAAVLSRPELAVVVLVVLGFAYVFRPIRMDSNSQKSLFWFSLFLITSAVVAVIYFSIIMWDPYVWGEHKGDFYRVLNRLSFTLVDSFLTISTQEPWIVMFFFISMFDPILFIYSTIIYVMYNAHMDSLAAIHYRELTSGVSGAFKYAALFTVPLLLFGIVRLHYTLRRFIRRRILLQIIGLIIFAFSFVHSAIVFRAIWLGYYYSDPLKYCISASRGHLLHLMLRASNYKYPENLPIVDAGAGTGLYLANIPLSRFVVFHRHLFQDSNIDKYCAFYSKVCEFGCVVLDSYGLHPYEDVASAVRMLISAANSCGYTITRIYSSPDAYLVMPAKDIFD